MTSYSAVSDSVDLAIRAVTYEIRITQVNLVCYAGGSEVILLNRHESSTLSGGSVADIVPLYQGAPAASATARSGSLTFSGTNKIVGSAFVGSGTDVSTIYYTAIINNHGSNAQIAPPLTLTVLPGSVLHVSGVTSGTIAQVFFEEMRLPGSY
jgi:hypothetical protein